MEKDWYAILGLQDSSKASSKAIRKAFYRKALLCHPDKRPDDSLASAKFQSIQKAYDVLSDKQARKAYDDLRERREHKVDAERKSTSEKVDPKKRKMTEDLIKKESISKALRRQEEDDKKQNAVKHALHTQILQMRENEKILKVSWQGSRTSYSDVRLRAIFEQFGSVEDIRLDLTQCSAFVVMSSRDEVVYVAASIMNPSLVVIPLVGRARFSSSWMQPTIYQKSVSIDTHRVPTSQGESNEDTISKLGSLDGSAFHSHEEAVLEKLRCKKAS